MSVNPTLSAVKRQQVDPLIDRLYDRIRAITPEEANDALAEIRDFLDHWETHLGLQSYWDDWKKEHSLLISAERAATIRALRGTFNSSARPTPNSLRDVEPNVTVRVK